MKGKLVCLCGETGTGKTTFIKNKIEFVYHREILCYLKLQDDFPIEGAKLYTNFQDFLRVCSTKKDCVIIIDEAWTALPDVLNVSLSNPNKLDNILADFLVNCRKLNNFVFIAYQALVQVPKWLIPYLNYFVRYRTNDQLNYQANRFKSFPVLANNLLNVKTVTNKPQVLKLR